MRDWRWNHKVKKKNLATNKCFCSNQESQTNPFENVSAQTKQHVTVNGILDLNLFPSTLQVGNPPGAILQVGARELSSLQVDVGEVPRKTICRKLERGAFSADREA